MYFCAHMLGKSTPGLELLFKNLQKGLKAYSPEELTEAITEVLKKKTDRNPEKDFIVSRVCEQYNITPRALIFGIGHNVYEARKLTACLLHYELGLSLRHIAISVFQQKSHYRVGEATRYFKTINPSVKTDRMFRDKYQNVQLKLIQFMNEKQNNAA